MSQDTTNTLRGHSAVALCAAAMLLLLASPAVAKPTRCHLTYDVEGWSIIYAGVGADVSIDARVMFKGSTRLSLVGKGSGINLGFVIGGFTIKAL